MPKFVDKQPDWKMTKDYAKKKKRSDIARSIAEDLRKQREIKEIDTPKRRPVADISKRIKKKLSKKILKSVPVIGGILSAIKSKDASAAVPVLGDVEKLGPRKGTPGSIIEDPSKSAKERKAAIKKILKKKEK